MEVILGHGDIASVLTDREDTTWFASGVSDSTCTDPAAYRRERQLLCEQKINRTANHLVYFSSLCIYDGTSDYAKHKRATEHLISKFFPYYTIVRLGNILWGNNPKTFVNFLRNNPEAPVMEVYRHVVGLEEFKYWMGKIKPGTADIMNIPGRMVWVPDFVKEIREGKYEP